MLDFLRIKKSYIFEFVKDGKQVGQGRLRVWFFVSAYKAHEIIASKLKEKNEIYICNFRRVY